MTEMPQNKGNRFATVGTLQRQSQKSLHQTDAIAQGIIRYLCIKKATMQLQQPGFTAHHFVIIYYKACDISLRQQKSCSITIDCYCLAANQSEGDVWKTSASQKNSGGKPPESQCQTSMRMFGRGG